MSTIPASAAVKVTPTVLTAGGSALDMNGLLLTSGTRVPVGTVARFASAEAVRSYFGSTSPEAIAAGGGPDMGTGYFGGFDDSNKKPGAVLFAQYNVEDVAAYARGGNLSTMTVAQLQSLTGSLNVTIDGVQKTSTPNLATATSFSNAALILAAALVIDGPQVASFTGSIAASVMTVSAVNTGELAVGNVVKGAGVTAGTYITSFGTATGGPGTYNVSVSQTVASEAMTADAQAVEFDPVSKAFVISSGTTGDASTINFPTGSLAISLKLTQSTGAVLSQGADAATPDAFMNSLVSSTQNWAAFGTIFDPDETGYANKLAFSAWVNGTNKRFAYVAQDSDVAPTTTVPATSSFGYDIDQNGYNGTCLVWEPSNMNHVPFVLGAIASIDFDQIDGRITFKFKRQAGLVAAVSDETTLNNLTANGYNCYGAYATANDDFVWFAQGTVTGAFVWLDSYVNQIWLNNALQLALVRFLVAVKAVAYTTAGYARIEASLADVVKQGLAFGAFRAGVTLSSDQVAAVNAAAGTNVARILSTRGWYLQILDASPETRAARGSPPMKFWYVDGQAVHFIDLTSTAVQ